MKKYYLITQEAQKQWGGTKANLPVNLSIKSTVHKIHHEIKARTMNKVDGCDCTQDHELCFQCQQWHKNYHLIMALKAMITRWKNGC